jgi:choline dehydrogenase
MASFDEVIARSAAFDTIIVGAGSAGCVLAARFTEDPNRNVLLIEAGPDYPERDWPEQITTFSVLSQAYDGPHMWGYRATANAHQPRPMPVPRGKVVGGSSAINGGMFLRGMPHDFAGWVDAGNLGWSFDEVLPYFRRTEHDCDCADPMHGHDGPTPVTRPAAKGLTRLHAAFAAACAADGVPTDPCMNHPDATGLGLIPMNAFDRRRIGAGMAYLDPVRDRPNLTILAGVHCNRIVFRGERAIGVEVRAATASSVATVHADDIVLCAGAVGSPQLLLLSGIGPADELAQLGIAARVDLPGVGRNLRDHPVVTPLFATTPTGRAKPTDPTVQLSYRYTTPGSAYRNDVMLTPVAMAGAAPGNEEGVGGTFSGGLTPESAAETTGVAMMLAHAESAGRLCLQSARPEESPLLDYDYLRDPGDLATLRHAVRYVDHLVAQGPYEGLVTRRVAPFDDVLADDRRLDGWLRRSVTTSHHISGTCKMGPDSDPCAVVDPRGVVRGVGGLRVIDASIMPNVVGVNPNATTLMIAERLADRC